ncbi:MAG: gamma-glutamylcyclotransferase [Burkholderiales bacterium]
MTITRNDLETGRIRKAIIACGYAPRLLSDQELEASIESVLARHPRGRDVWVFGYGSLIWNPLVHYTQRRLATVYGYHRRYCLWSIFGRGTPDAPGMMLGLDRGGRCQGVAYRLEAAKAVDELRLLWCREMVTGVYMPRWVRVRDADDTIDAITFVVDRSHPWYAGKVPLDRIAGAIKQGKGMIGSSADYLRQTCAELVAHGIADSHLFEVHAAVFGTTPKHKPG